MERFYWMVPGILAGCSRPGVRRRWWGRDDALDEDLATLRGHGIRAVLSLTEEPLPADELARHGLESLHLPIVDMQPPTAEQFREALAFIDRFRMTGEPVAVHCLAGQGRTGSILAAYLIREGMSADAALSELRTACPGAVENDAQEAALADFAARREWLV